MARKQKKGKNTLLTNVVLGLLGLFLIFWPGASLTIACRLAGIGLVLVGAAALYAWWKDHGMRPTDLALLIGAGVAVLLGVWILCDTARFEKLIPTVLGIVMVIFGAVGLVRAFRGHDTVSMVLTGIVAVIGLIIAFRPISSVKTFCVVAGIALVYTAGTGIAEELRLRK